MKATIADITLAIGLGIVMCCFALSYFDILTY